MARSTKLIYSGQGGSEPPPEDSPEHDPAMAKRQGTMLGVGNVSDAVAEAQAKAKEVGAADVQVAGDELEQAAESVPTLNDGTRPRPRLALGTLQPDHEVRRCPVCATQYSGPESFCSFDGEQLQRATNWDPTIDPLLGRTVSERYVVEGVLAEGGMGTVYRVRHAKLDNQFAMKVLRRDLAEDPDVANRLIDEARATAAIGHANIVSVSDFGEIDNQMIPDLGDLKLPFFVMEFVPGGSLADAINERGGLEVGRIVSIMGQVAAALTAAHAGGIVHRDLKPENIRLSQDETGNEVAKVLDFGVAKIIGASKKTRQGIVFGTPHYMSPEQGQGQPVDNRTDIYAMGVIMYECLTGSVPFAADTYMAVVEQHMFATPEPIVATSAEAKELSDVVMRCLMKNPEGRYDSMTELAAQLERLAPPPARPSSAPMASRHSLQMRGADSASASFEVPTESPRAWFAAAGLVVAALAVMTLVVLRSSSDESSAAAPSATAAATASAVASAASAATTSEPSSEPSSQPSASTSAETAAKPPSTQPKAVMPPKPPPPRRRRRKSSGELVDPWAQ